MPKKPVITNQRDRSLYPLALLAIVIAAALIFFAYWRLIGPTQFTIAIPQQQSDETDLIDALAATLAEGKRGVKLNVRREGSLEAVAGLMEKGLADIAVVRPDVSLPTNGLTVAILREEAIVILYPTAQKLAGIAGLKGKTLAIIGRGEADERAIKSTLAFYDVAEQVRVVRVDAQEASQSLSAGRVAAVAFIATPGSLEARRLARAVAGETGKPVSLLPVGQGEAFHVWSPAFSSIKIPAGGLLTDPVTPREETDGVAISWRLMARSGLDRGPISTLTERLFESRSLLARSSSAALTMKAPDADNATSAILPNHRGALDYLNREQLTFMDRYGDWLWFALFAATGVSSAFAWIGRLFTRRRREVVDEALGRLGRMLTEARNAQSHERLSELSTEIDRLVAIAVWRARKRTTTQRTISALMLAIDAARAAVRERRDELTRNASFNSHTSAETKTDTGRACS